MKKAILTLLVCLAAATSARADVHPILSDGSTVPDAAITTAKINTAAVTTPKLNTDAVTSAKIMDTAVTTEKISNGAVTTGKLATDSVAAFAILGGAVTTNKLATDAVGTSAILNGSVTAAKLASGVGAAVFNSTTTIVPIGQTFTNTIYGPCVISTVTMTTSGGKILVMANVQANNDTALQTSGLSVLMDGDHLTGDDGIKNTNTAGLEYFEGTTGGYYVNQGFTFLQQAPSAGSHSWCITGKVSANTGTIGAGVHSIRQRFTILELK